MLFYGQSVNLLDVAASGLTLLLFSTVIKRYLVLRHIPGPFLASVTDFWLLGVMRYGDYRTETLELDRTYGKLVRYGPRRVLFSDVKALPQVYGTTNVFQKAKSYDTITPYINGRLVPSLISSRDENEVSAVKRQISHAFSSTAVLDYEHHIDETIANLIKTLQNCGSQADLQKCFSTFAFETLCRVGFSDDADMTSRGHDMEDVIKGGQRRFQYWRNWLAIPCIEHLLFNNKFGAKFSKPEILTTIAAKRVRERIEKGGAASSHQDLLDRYFQAQEKAPTLFDTSRIIALTLTIVNAGSDTTGHSLTIALYYILTHPHVYARLEREINESNLSFPPRHAEVVKLPYLEACIKESQRVQPIARGPIEREVPPSGTTILDTFIPGGTVVAFNKSALAIDPTIFDPLSRHDIDRYIPERWLDVNPTQLAIMDRANFMFSHGKRICLGVHLAWSEMLKVIPALFMRFDIELQDPNFQLQIDSGVVGFVAAPGLPVVVKEKSLA